MIQSDSLFTSIWMILIILYHWLIDSYSNDSVWLILCVTVMGLNWCDLSLYRGGLAERLNRLHCRQRSAISFWRHQCNSTTSAGKTHPVWIMSVYVKTRWWMLAECRSLEASSLLLTTNDNILKKLSQFKCKSSHLNTANVWSGLICTRKIFNHQPAVFIFP